MPWIQEIVSLSTPFLVGFTRAILTELIAREQVELQEGTAERVASYVANVLGEIGPHRSLISCLSSALIRCPWVDELYCDDDELKAMVEGLESTPAMWIVG